VRPNLLSRVAVPLLALLLSGAPGVIARQAPAGTHRCGCRSHLAEEECDCAPCRRATARAPNHPPCHVAAAREGARAATAPAPRPACVEGACGAGSRPAHPILAGVDAFLLPPAVGPPGRRGGREAIAPAPSPRGAGTREPETPPPRRPA
jgi:hypothetical protein